jgi:putative drug exporter of the RND superfamily
VIVFVVTALRFPILLAWIAAAVAATVYLPAIATSGNIDTLIPKDAPAVRAEVDATRLFGVPLSAQVAVVQRNPRGFASAQLVAAGLRAAAVDEGHAAPIAGLADALPISNAGRLIPGRASVRPRSSRSCSSAPGPRSRRRPPGARRTPAVTWPVLRTTWWG